MPTSLPPIKTLADVLTRVDDIPPDRVRFQPTPGTATLRDVIDIKEREGKLCELIDGVLVEQVMGLNESFLAGYLVTYLNVFIMSQDLGMVSVPDGTVELESDLVRIPDVTFFSWDRLPDGCWPSEPIPRIAPNLAVEILSHGNTPGEMAAKRRDYFAAGVQLVWEIDRDKQTVEVYTSPTQSTTLEVADTLDGGVVLPGFRLELKKLFGRTRRQG